VVVSGAIFSDKAETVASITKILQTIALGPCCLAIAYYWNVIVDPGKEPPSVWLIYDKFPKFVFGFLSVCFLVTFVMEPCCEDNLDSLIRVVKGMERWWAIMGFTAIGLKSDLRKMKKKLGKGGGGNIISLYVVGGTLDILLCLGFSSIWFSGLLIPAPEVF
jgi:uncharacterized membrane protein YadS